MKHLENKKLAWLIMALIIVIGLSSCTAGNSKFDLDPAGFWWGLWHGFISLITFIVSLFNDNVSIYEINNGGKLYDLGFILGIAMFYGGSCKGSCRR